MTSLSLDSATDTPLNRLRHDLDVVKTSSKNDHELVTGLLLRVPTIQSLDQFVLFVKTVLEFKHLPDIDRVAFQLIVMADHELFEHPYSRALADCVVQPVTRQYPDPYPIDDFLKTHEGTDASLVKEFLKPWREWGATTIGRYRSWSVPAGLINGLMQLLPRLDAFGLEDLLNELRGRFNAGTETDLLAATVARVIALIDQGPRDDLRHKRVEQILMHLCPAPDAKRHAVVQERRFQGISQEIQRLEKQLNDLLNADREKPELQAMSNLAAIERFFCELLALLPQAHDVADLELLEAAAQRVPAEFANAAMNYRRTLYRQKLEWALGMPTAVSACYPKVDEAMNALLLLLVAPKVALSQLALSAQRPDIQTVEGLRTVLDTIPLDNPSPNDLILLNALAEKVREVLQLCCNDGQPRALVLATIAALKDRPKEQVEQLKSQVFARLGLTQAAPLQPVLTPVPHTVSPDKATPGMPGGQVIRQSHASWLRPPTHAPREVVVSSFIAAVEKAVYDYRQPVHDQGPRRGQREGNALHNKFNETLVGLVPTLSTQRDVQALRQAMQWLPSPWKHDRVVRALVLRYHKACQERNVQATPLDAKRTDKDTAMKHLMDVLPEG